jgi:hypothetical protein
MFNHAFNTIAGYDDFRSDTPNNYKATLAHKNHNDWWESMKRDFQVLVFGNFFMPAMPL